MSSCLTSVSDELHFALQNYKEYLIYANIAERIYVFFARHDAFLFSATAFCRLFYELFAQFEKILYLCTRNKCVHL